VHFETLDVARLFVGTAVLSFASWTDWRWRRAPNILWMLMGAAGGLLLLLQLSLEPFLLTSWPMLVIAGAFAGMMFLFYRIGLLAGGADMKALACLAVLAPLPIHLGAFPLRPSLLPPPFAILGDALVAFLAVPLGLLITNVARGHLRLPHALLGLKLPVGVARLRHLWPMEHVEDGKVKTVWMPSRYAWDDEDWDALLAAGHDLVWVTPKVPFMLPLLLGFVTAFFAGDLLFGWMGANR
jgi:archaeal preflagellin peptidase FlaK